MGLFSFLFGKKKKAIAPVNEDITESDGQEKYLLDKEPEDFAAPPAVEEKKASATVIPGDKVIIEGTGGRTLKDTVKKTESKNTNANKVIKKVGGVVVSDEPKTANQKAAPVKKDAPKVEETPVSEDGEVLESKTTRSGKFELKRAKDGRFFFNLYASNHTVIAFSQIYSSSSSALNGIKSVMANAGIANNEDTTLKNPTSAPFPKWEIYIDRANQYRFRLYAGNGNCVCHAAHGYTTKSGCKGGIDSIIRFASEARIDKKYLVK